MPESEHFTGDEFLDDGEAGGLGLEERLDELEHRLNEVTNSSHRDGGGFVGYGFGTILAMILSWSRNASILWCILHGLFSWFYVVYFAVTR